MILWAAAPGAQGDEAATYAEGPGARDWRSNHTRARGSPCGGQWIQPGLRKRLCRVREIVDRVQKSVGALPNLIHDA